MQESIVLALLEEAACGGAQDLLTLVVYLQHVFATSR